MSQQLLLLLRVSKPEYNKTLYRDYRLYMNSQLLYRNEGFSKGQFDEKEGMIADNNIRLLYSADDKNTWKELHGIRSLHKNNNAYIFCMYGITYNEESYVAKTNTYYHFIPWEYIRDLWTDDIMEMLVVKNTSVFIKKFKESAEASGLPYAFGKVHYADKPPFYELPLINDGALLFDSVPLKKGNGVMIELTDVVFNEDKTMSVRFSSKIKYYKPTELYYC